MLRGPQLLWWGHQPVLPAERCPGLGWILRKGRQPRKQHPMRLQMRIDVCPTPGSLLLLPAPFSLFRLALAACSL